MTNTPMTFEEWFKSSMVDPSIGIIETDPKSIAESAWEASQAQQASLIAELVEALERAKDMVGHEDNIAFIAQAIAKVKGK